jgi:transcriptional regulator with PAS, ATPase and Fis domain
MLKNEDKITRKRGRPLTADGQHRDYRMLVRYSDKERKILKQASRYSGMKISVMVRGESLKFAKEIIRLCENGDSPFPF